MGHVRPSDRGLEGGGCEWSDQRSPGDGSESGGAAGCDLTTEGGKDDGLHIGLEFAVVRKKVGLMGYLGYGEERERWKGSEDLVKRMWKRYNFGDCDAFSAGVLRPAGHFSAGSSSELGSRISRSEIRR